MRSSVGYVAPLVLVLTLTACGTTSASDPAPQPSHPEDRTHHRHERPGWPAPVEMHSYTSPRAPGGDRATTYGLGDLDGDGRQDLVQVRTDGLVSAELTTVGHRATRLPANPTLRLQALPDLDGDGQAEVLVASTASGCCRGYRFTEFRSAVLTLEDGELGPLRWATGQPMTVPFDQGRGELYAGIRCDGGVLHLLQAVDARTSARLTDTSVHIIRDVAHRDMPVTRTVPSAEVPAETRSHCPGVDGQGWAD